MMRLPASPGNKTLTMANLESAVCRDQGGVNNLFSGLPHEPANGHPVSQPAAAWRPRGDRVEVFE
jgi:hypothetical protein